LAHTVGVAESSFCVFRYNCGRCGETFTDITKGDEAYGELAARSAGTGQLVYINTFADPVFSEVSELGGLVLAEAHLSPPDHRRGPAIQHAYAAACDLSGDGTVFQVGAHPHCPACGNDWPSAWEHTGEHLTCDIPEPSHERWRSLTPEQRKALVRKHVMNSLSE
jgi:hypothetical protein